VAEDPQVIDAWFMLGNEFFKKEAWTDAIDMFRRALELKPDYDLAIINMANAYRRLGRDDAALAGYERYIQIDPKNAYVRYQIGEIYLDRGERCRLIRNSRRHRSLPAQLRCSGATPRRPSVSCGRR
jgi:tetratricopeptide (TPR) repeat protein